MIDEDEPAGGGARRTNEQWREGQMTNSELDIPMACRLGSVDRASIGLA